MKQNIILLSIAIIICIVLCIAFPEAKDEPAPISYEEPNWTDFTFSIYYLGKLHTDMGFVASIPENAKLIGTIQKITEKPEKDLESSWGQVGDNVYIWTKENNTWIGIEIVENALPYWNEPHAFAQEIPIF